MNTFLNFVMERTNNFMLCLAIIFAVNQVSLANVVTEEMFKFLDDELSSTPRKVPLNLGRFRHFCVGNLDRCPNGFTVSVWITPTDSGDTDKNLYYLSSGGQSPHSNGFYIRRKYNKDFEIGVGYDNREWSTKSIFLQDGKRTNLAFTWLKTTNTDSMENGLKIYIDGLFVQADSVGNERIITNPDINPFQHITVGQANSVVMTNSTNAEMIIHNITHWSEVISGESLNNAIGIDETDYHVGCASDLPTGSDTFVESDVPTVLECRKICYNQTREYVFFQQALESCNCFSESDFQNAVSENVVNVACSGTDKWMVYRTGGDRKNVYFPIDLDVDITWPTNKGYVRPNETIIFTFTTMAKEDVIYNIDYDDGIQKVTRDNKIGHSWSTIGEFNISINAATRVSTQTKYVLINIEWRDEGIPPELVQIQVDNHPNKSLQVSNYITAIGIEEKNCSLSFGDGEIVYYSDKTDMIFNDIISHTYNNGIGFYHVTLDCENDFGTRKDEIDVVATHPKVEFEYYPMGVDIQIPVVGIDVDMYYDQFVVLVNKENVSKKRIGGNMSLSHSVFSYSGDHILQLRGNGKIMFTKIFNLQHTIDNTAIKVNILQAELNQQIQFTFVIGNGDFLHIHIEYGDAQEEYLYAPLPDSPLEITKSHSYSELGQYIVRLTVANDISSQMIEKLVSIERPIGEVKMVAINTTVIGDPTVFTFEVDMDRNPAMPIQVKFEYGDGNSETVILGEKQNHPVPITYEYTYNTYGMYNVKASVGNNISSLDVSVTLQVGEHITYVDVYTDKNRVVEEEDITFTVHSPRGAPIKLEIDTGDNNVIIVHRPEVSQQFVDGIIPSSTIATFLLSPNGGSGSGEGSGDIEGLLTRRRREISNSSLNLDGSGDEYDNNAITTPMYTTLPVTKEPNEDFLVVYRYPKSGRYLVKVKVSNKFNQAETWLCPEIIVIPKAAAEPLCNVFSVNLINGSSLLDPIVMLRSDAVTLPTDVNIDCSSVAGKIAALRYTWSIEWLTAQQNWRPELQVCHTELSSDSLIIDPNTLWYGTYRLKVTASVRMVDDDGNSGRKKREVLDVGIPTMLEAESEYTYLKVVRSPLVAKIKGEDAKKDVTLWDIINVNMTPSYDPDVSVANKTGIQFHLFCYPQSVEDIMESYTLDDMIRQSAKLANNSFNTASIYETEACFERYERIWVVGQEAVFPGAHASTNDTLVFDLFITKDVRVARTKAAIRVWTTNLTMDNAMNAIDALLASGDTSAALMVIDMVTDGLNGESDPNDTDAKNERADLRGKLIGVMGNVADSLSNFDQLDKTAGSVGKLTAIGDEVTDDGRKKAAGALGSAAEKADQLAEDADLNLVSGLALNMVGAAGNVLPFAAEDEEEEEEIIATTTAKPDTYLDLLKPTIEPPTNESAPVVEVIIPCCEREAGLCEWVEPECIVLDDDERKGFVWDDITCDEVHPDDLLVIKERFENWKLAKKLNKFYERRLTTTSGWNACLKVGEVIGKKQDGAGAETNIDTPKMKMKVASLDTSSNASLGAFSVPPGVMGDLGTGAAATVMDTPNPFTYSDSASSVKGKVMTMAFKNPDGSPMKISNTTEPFNIWMAGKPEKVPEPSIFTFLSSSSGPTMNFHTINITTNDTGLHAIIRPASPYDVYYVYLKYEGFPNETYYDWKGEVPNDASYDTDDAWKLQQLQYTVFPPQNYTTYNGSYKLGIKLKETRLSLEQLNEENNFTYSMQVFLSGCRFWDDDNETWSSEGCEIGKLTTIRETQCLCNHLTSFGGDFVVPPNTIDFNTVFSLEKFLESMPVFITVILIILLYIAVLVWARKEDQKDLIKWGSTPLEDNLPTDTYHYQMTVHTAVKKGSGTQSKVSFILSGDDCDSGVRRLYDGHRKEFPNGSIYNYVVSVENCLGALNYLRIWHDNSGKGKKKGWMLNQVVITDIQTGKKSFFLCDRWLAVEEDDGQVERILPVAGLGDLSAFKHLFSSSVRKKLSSDHMWFSILSRPTKSTFTRVQRVSCCVSLLFLTMITNCMFFKADEGAQTTKALSIGPISFTLHQLFISIVSTAIVFPPSLAIVTIFKKARPKKNSAVQVTTSHSKKFKWRTINPGSSLWQNVEKSRLQKFQEALRNILSFHQKSKYASREDAYLQQQDHQGVIKRKPRKKSSGCMLPYWTNYIAWTLVFFSVVASGFFTILYSMEWGREKSIDWLTTFVLSFFQSVIVVQPVKVLLLAAFISCILRKPEINEEEEDAFDEAHMGDEPTSSVADLTTSQRDLQELLRQRQLKPSDLPPPDTESLNAAREYRMKELETETILKECIVYFLFILVLFFLSYQTRDPDSFAFANNIKNQFRHSKFDSISRPDTFWFWIRTYFVPNLYSGPHVNGKKLSWQEALQIDDRITIRVGVPRIRQQRIRDDSCKIQPAMKPLINHCRAEYNWNDDDTDDYLPGWHPLTGEQINQTAQNFEDRYCGIIGGDLASLNNEKTSPWVYRNSFQLKNAPYAGVLGMYKGGGYNSVFRRTRSKTEKLLDILEKNEWIDVRTRAVFIEFTLYNANANLFASVILLVEWMATGSAVTRAEVKVFRLYSYVGGFGVIVMLFEVIFLVFTIYFTIHMIREIKKHKKGYFKDFWNLLEMATLVLSLISVGMYGAKKVMGTAAVNALKEAGSEFTNLKSNLIHAFLLLVPSCGISYPWVLGEYVNFVTISIWDEIFSFMLALVVFTSTLKFIKLLKFNKRMGMLGDTIKLAAKDLAPFMITFFVYFFSFCMTAYVLFGKNLPSYGTFVGTIEALFAFALGDFDFYALEGVDMLLGPLFFFAYVAVVYIGLMGMFLTIIDLSFSVVKHNPEYQSNDYEIVDFMMKKFKGIIGMS